MEQGSNLGGGENQKTKKLQAKAFLLSPDSLHTKTSKNVEELDIGRLTD